MIHEIAELEIIEGKHAEFQAAVAEASQYFKAAKGYHSMSLTRSIEQPNKFRLTVGWETIEDHTVHFRESQGFQEWRRLAGPFFNAPPTVEHVSTVFKAEQ